LSDAAADPLASSAMGIRLDTSWFDALASLARSPLLGTGPASLGEAVGVDGLYILLLGTGGVLGLIFFLLLIFRAVRYQRRSICDTGNELQKALALGLFAATIALLVNGFTQDTFFNSKVAFTYWFLMGLLLVGRRLEARSLYFARVPVPVMNMSPSPVIQPATSNA
jgi:O-antigen ligase